MARQQLVIVHEGLPSRCEICHQADRFDRVSGECKRCGKIAKSLPRPIVTGSHPDDVSPLQVFGALLLFAAHIFFLPNARAFIYDRLATLAIYSMLFIIGSALLFCGKRHDALTSYLRRRTRRS